MEPEKKPSGAVVGLVIIIIILVAGGIYIWQSNQKEMQENATETEEVTAEDSTDLDSLNAELDATDTSTGVDVDTVY